MRSKRGQYAPAPALLIRPPEAVQESLGRPVALKVLPVHGLLSPTHLERFGPAAQEAVPALLAAAKAKDRLFREVVFMAVRKIDPQSTVMPLN